MKILTAEEMGAADRATFTRLGIPSRAVMESAAREVVAVLCRDYAEALAQGVVIVCGGGNNGGDGFAAARLLFGLGINVQVLSIKSVSELKGDARANANSLQALGVKIEELSEASLKKPELIRGLEEAGLILDALYGTGFRGSSRGLAAKLITILNKTSFEREIPLIAVDIASGVEADTGKVHGEAITADATVALQCLKLGHVTYPGAQFGGAIYCADIGVPNQLPEISGIPRCLLSEQSVAASISRYLSEGPETHKNIRGHVLVLGGSPGHYGAPHMAAEAALRCGAGLVSIALPATVAHQAAPQYRELMSISLPDDGQGNFAEPGDEVLEAALSQKAALVLGPGIGQSPGSATLVQRILEKAKERFLPVVIDADGLNILADTSAAAKLLGPHAVLTPHPGEMARLVGATSSDIQANRLGYATKLAEEWNCTVVLKGAGSIVAAADGRVKVSPTAEASLAVGGSGDVLSGIVGAFLARGAEAPVAAGDAVFIHGASGELSAIENDGSIGTRATDLLSYAPLIINALLNLPTQNLPSAESVLPNALHRLLETFFG